jgi:hypothetical protein
LPTKRLGKNSLMLLTPIISCKIEGGILHPQPELLENEVSKKSFFI